MAADSTLIIRGRPIDPTPGWVGDPAHKPPGSVPPPWLEAAQPVRFEPHVEATSSCSPAQGPTSASASAVKPTRIQLLAYDSDLTSELERSPTFCPAFVDRSQSASPPSEARALSDMMESRAPCDAEGVAAVVASAARADGSYRAPLVLVEGEIVFELDDVERLRSTLPCLLPLAPTAPEIEAAVAHAKAVLSTVPVPLAAARSATEQMWRVHGGSKEMLKRQRAQIDRGLLIRGALKRRALGDRELVRVIFFFAGSGARLRVFVPDPLLDQLVPCPRVRCRALVSLDLLSDRTEPLPIVGRLRALAATRG